MLSAHGLCGSRAAERRAALTDYSVVADAGRRLVAYDARGHGETGGTTDPADYSWKVMGDDLIELARHFSPTAPVSAIGCSMGTGAVLHAVTTAPDRFDRLVLTAPPTAWEARAAQGEIYRKLADYARHKGVEALHAALAKAPVPAIFAEVEGFPPTPDVPAELLPTVLLGAGISDLPPRAALAAITQPTLILAWAGDPGHPVSLSETIAATIPGATLHVSETRADLFSWGERAAAFLT
ncbi:alpha/beta superfamily hydrolase/acyltransferase [Actinoplanes sp. N902-109]|nr:alpha/beta superfamily hydrolase/acyltransferase [Actinoplanes sp. N902-109]